METGSVPMSASVVGRSKYEIDTPALVVDLPTMERNIATMAKRIIGSGKNWRPHTKGQKIPAVAHMELAAGAMGVTCAKLGEAEVMAGAGIRDILIANQIVGEQKATRLANLRRHADVIVCVDSAENVAELSAAMQAKGVELRVLIELNVGMNRSGVLPGQPVLDLARKVADAPSLRLAGLMAWEANCTGLLDQAAKRECIEHSLGLLTSSADLCRREGLPIDIVSCGGTGTYWISATIPGVTEMQAGGGIFNDVHYAEDFGLDHEFALTIMTTVISRPAPDRIIVDAGRKTMSCDAAMPRPLGLGEVESVGLSAEHGKVILKQPSETPRIGDRLEFIVGYSDTTTFLHDEMYGIRDGNVEVVWPILGRGKLR
jgi:D-serine deaminase-like pyridoxal phosphate-dependent protein